MYTGINNGYGEQLGTGPWSIFLCSRLECLNAAAERPAFRSSFLKGRGYFPPSSLLCRVDPLAQRKAYSAHPMKANCCCSSILSIWALLTCATHLVFHFHICLRLGLQA